MSRISLATTWWVLSALLLLACVGPQPTSRPGAPDPVDARPVPKRVVMAMIGNPPALNNRFSFSGTVQGLDLLEKLVSAGRAG